jgi:peptidyl-prolyl cis-trans isomerase C
MQISVNGDIISEADIRREKAALRERYRDAYENMPHAEVEHRLIGLAQDALISRILLDQEARTAVEPLPERLKTKVQRPTRKEIDLYYKTHRSQFAAPERMLARHIVKNLDQGQDRAAALESISAARAELANGAAFADVADRYSDCAGNGGALGWFAAGTMVPEFEEALMNLQPGEISGIFETRFGLHIAQVLDRRPEGIVPLNEIREYLAEMLLEQRQRAALQAFVAELRGRADIRFE